VHVPLSVEAQMEARVLMMSTNNILSPATGRPIIGPSQDIVLGCYYMTREQPGVRGEGMRFSSPEEVRVAYDASEVELHAAIKVRMNGKLMDTTTGRILLSEIVPAEIPFEIINHVMDKKALGELIDQAYRRLGNKATVLLADRLRSLGYQYATRAGVSICIEDMKIPADKERVIGAANVEVQQIEQQYQEGLITDGERYNKVIDIWANATERIAADARRSAPTRDGRGRHRKQVPSFSSASGDGRLGRARIAAADAPAAGMRGLMAKPSGESSNDHLELPRGALGAWCLSDPRRAQGPRRHRARPPTPATTRGSSTSRRIIREETCGVDGIEVGPLVGAARSSSPWASASWAEWPWTTSTTRCPARCWSAPTRRSTRRRSPASRTAAWTG
jgi:DNA-directed RNA polymerase subunit beta'